MARSGLLKSKTLLLIDKEAKVSNDRTWCFWEKGTSNFDEIIYSSWKELWVRSENSDHHIHLDAYSYKMIRGIDFYQYCDEVLKQFPSVTRIFEQVNEISSTAEGAMLKAGEGNYYCSFLFSSIITDSLQQKQGEHFLLQHFCGWFLNTEEAVFDNRQATLMDFNVPQQGATAFVYLLPFSEKQALMEYTVLSNAVLDKAEYNSVLGDYLAQKIKTGKFTVTETESGVIPMTSRRFKQRDGNIIFTGTAGGQTKPSSGYTFRFIQKQSAAIVSSLINYNHPFNVKKTAARFRWYDNVMLRILEKGRPQGKDIFTSLFSRNEAAAVFRFLDNESTVADELQIMRSVPQWPFIRAGMLEFFGL